MLFQAATKTNTFQELHIFYFHNCVYESVYRRPQMRWEDSVPTEWLLQNFDGAYRVILVGDAAMHPGELFSQQYNWRQRTPLPSGLDWLLRLKSHFPHLIWLNPEPLPSHGGFWAQTHLELAKQFPMYQLSVEGLEAGMRRLMAR